MPDYHTYHLKVSLLTPLHIGNGQKLLHRYDYLIYQGKTWRIDHNALLDAQDVDDARLADHLARTPFADLLNPAKDCKPDSPYFRYIIRGTPRSSGEGAVVQEQIKDAFDHPYLPGTALKGAFRTALAWYIWKEKGARVDMAKIGPNRKWAARNYEKVIFGPTPNKDYLRALHVSDSQAVAPEQMMLINVSVFNRGGSVGAPIELEAVRPDTVFKSEIKIDLALFSRWAQRYGLRLGNSAYLENLLKIIQAYSYQRIQREQAWFRENPKGGAIATFYGQLAGVNLADNQCLLQLGWGTGWSGKTFGSHLQDDVALMESLIQKFRLTRGRRQAGDPFPKSRRVAVSVKSGHPVPRYPLGWALLEMVPKM